MTLPIISEADYFPSYFVKMGPDFTMEEYGTSVEEDAQDDAALDRVFGAKTEDSTDRPLATHTRVEELSAEVADLKKENARLKSAVQHRQVELDHAVRIAEKHAERRSAMAVELGTVEKARDKALRDSRSHAALAACRSRQYRNLRRLFDEQSEELVNDVWTVNKRVTEVLNEHGVPRPNMDTPDTSLTVLRDRVALGLEMAKRRRPSKLKAWWDSIGQPEPKRETIS